VPGGTACCIETSQRLSGAPRVDNYTAQTFASWSRRGEEMTPQGADGAGAEVISTNRGELKQTRKLQD